MQICSSCFTQQAYLLTCQPFLQSLDGHPEKINDKKLYRLMNKIITPNQHVYQTDMRVSQYVIGI